MTVNKCLTENCTKPAKSWGYCATCWFTQGRKFPAAAVEEPVSSSKGGLSDEVVAAIFTGKESQRVCMELYGVSQSQCRDIRLRKTYKTVTEGLKKGKI